MNSVGERWLSLDKHPEEIPQFEAVSDASGSFVIEAPLPSSDWITLRVTPDEFHGEAGRNFGRAGGRDEPYLLEGDNDLGVLTLTDAGAFEGVVLDEDGNPVEGVRVSVSNSFPGGYVVAASTQADGTYRVGHVPAGRYDIETKKRGYLTAKNRGVLVRNGRVRSEVDFRGSHHHTGARRI
ncbi:MAG: carboxypeptidase-like regulatory domain-containing protein [Planctomycetota bacterium]